MGMVFLAAPFSNIQNNNWKKAAPHFFEDYFFLNWHTKNELFNEVSDSTSALV